MSSPLEIEIKSLLGSAENAQKLKQNLAKKFPDLKHFSTHKQLNHYFNEPSTGAVTKKLITALKPLIAPSRHGELEKILAGKKISIRTRDADGKVLFVVKASIGTDTSSNGVSRIEFESQVEKSLNELDAILLRAGLTYQAKWSRERQEFKAQDVTVSIDKNAGYGYLAEFEKIVSNPKLADSVRSDLALIMDQLGVEELKQDRLERMFAHYNAHWQDYYGTDNVFVIE